MIKKETIITLIIVSFYHKENIIKTITMDDYQNDNFLSF